MRSTLILLRSYVTILAITFNNVGYFVGGFSVKECEHFYMISPVLKVVQVMISQTILGLRTYGIGGRSKKLGIFLLTFWIVCTVGEWFMGLYERKFLQDQNMNCIATNDPKELYAWAFYLIAMVYDLVTFGISCYYLMYGLPWDFFKFSKFVRMLVFDGMQYFVALTAVNILNLIIYRSKDRWIQSSAAPFGYLITWIMSQRILIHMRESARANVQVPTDASVDFLFAVTSDHEAGVLDRCSETISGCEVTRDTGRRSLSIVDGGMQLDETKCTRQLDGDI